MSVCHSVSLGLVSMTTGARWKIELETPIYHTSYYYTRHVLEQP